MSTAPAHLATKHPRGRRRGPASRRASGEAGGGEARSRNWALAAILGVVVFAADLACPSGMTADSKRAVTVAASMVHFHSIGLDHYRPLPNGTFAITVVHGHYYPYFPWAVSLFAVPWVVGYDILHRLGVGEGTLAMIRSAHDWPLQVVSMSAVVAVTSVVLFFVAMRLLRLPSLARRRRWALAVALAFAFASPAWSTASRSMWQHGPSMLCLSLALLFALRALDGKTGWAGMGAALAAGYAVRPTDSIELGVLLVWVLIAHRRYLVNAVAGAIPPMAVFLAVNDIAYGSLLPPYYSGGSNFSVSHTMLVALAGNLVSPARGLLIFCPLVVLSAAGLYIKWRKGELDWFWRALAVIPVLHWIVISAFKHWWGGDSFGPRFFSDLMPVFVVLAMPAVEALAERTAAGVRSRRTRVAGRRQHPRGAGWRRHPAFASLVAVALCWSFLVNAQGAILRSAWCWNNEPTDVDAHPSKVWSWSDAQFDRGIRRLIWGPDRSSELIRDGVDEIGCPSEPVRP
ncbi:MAG: hypothetical protein ACRDWW_05375 [Acidimicrobiales bacterium]